MPYTAVPWIKPYRSPSPDPDPNAPYRTPEEKIWNTLRPVNQYHDDRWGFYAFLDPKINPKTEEFRRFSRRLEQYLEAGLTRTSEGRKLNLHSDYGLILINLRFWEEKELFGSRNGKDKTVKERTTAELIKVIQFRFERYLGQEELNDNPDNHRWYKGTKERTQLQKRLTKYVYPMFIDQEVVDSVLKGEEPVIHTMSYTGPFKQRKAFVKIIKPSHWRHKCDLPEKRRHINPGPDVLPLVEGCEKEDVGWMKASVGELLPGIYAKLLDHGWKSVYRRPPEIVCGIGDMPLSQSTSLPRDGRAATQLLGESMPEFS